jgi:hypothetical protein
VSRTSEAELIPALILLGLSLRGLVAEKRRSFTEYAALCYSCIVKIQNGDWVALTLPVQGHATAPIPARAKPVPPQKEQKLTRH